MSFSLRKPIPKLFYIDWFLTYKVFYMFNIGNRLTTWGKFWSSGES